ncbi:cell division protein FtsA [Lederbergia wuyishanensis]|uniref:Cell division protein FtsA n=1 Tax=Lederbergia wuyishanensis TaxID=1347903 RepID=A0ABU0D509_9BACI|nr:cell division protein FtsA [Lederbergia wuyishanensis]MCJ8009584.1 cell division protein FtsA [Lederbergia wuyishanensis]MDQ0343490.1 cell division protein FtsA [Lederbergia wuyishanensis]
MQGEKIFALDIGTRSVVGLIIEENREQYKVLDLVVKEHQARAMVDGQIHDIQAVAHVIKEVKEQLEIKYGKLSKVCVAAAGRSLKTERAKSVINIKGKPIINQEDILYLELAAVQNAQAVAAERQSIEKMNTYYCVGYSVLHYFIDNQLIGNLIDQQGDEASVEIIATFLPRVVVDSLIKALQRAELELDALTLEPIAAINVLVPVSMRRLNVALVDIGAGTSDIAITNTGTVVAYGMVPTAGDEITEAISDQLLLDFPEAEQAKRELWEQDSIIVHDILGFENEISKADVIAQISPAIDKLSREIGMEIRELNNGQSPKAVMLVGGGSKTPELPKRLAEMLHLPENRVAIRGAEAIQGLTFADHIPGGPENITPIGIAISARKSPIQYVTVTVNEQTTRMFEVKDLTVADCILASGIMINKLYGKPGMAIIVTMNGQQVTIPGSYGEPPILLKNEKECSLEDSIKNGDVIVAKKGADGEQSHIRIRDLIDDVPTKHAIINGKPHHIPIIISKNGKRASLNDNISDRDEIIVHIPRTISELLSTLKMIELFNVLQPFILFINGKESFIPSFTGEILLNGKKANENEPLPVMIDLNIRRKLLPTITNLASSMGNLLKRSITVFFNHKRITVTKAVVEYKRNGENINPDDELFSGDHIEWNETSESNFIFQDIFNFVDVNKPENASGNFSILINNEEATFYSQIHNGDHLEIIWPTLIDKK